MSAKYKTRLADRDPNSAGFTHRPSTALATRATAPTAPCWRCGARAGCDHRSIDR